MKTIKTNKQDDDNYDVEADLSVTWFQSLHLSEINSLKSGLKVDARCFTRLSYECLKTALKMMMEKSLLESFSDMAIDSCLSESDILIF